MGGFSKDVSLTSFKKKLIRESPQSKTKSTRFYLDFSQIDLLLPSEVSEGEFHIPNIWKTLH